MKDRTDLPLNVPPGFERAVQLTREELEAHVRLMAALKMFELGKLSAGRAADLAGCSRPEFLEACGRYRVSVYNYSANEAADELQHDLEVLRDESK
jgi:predicted HTH domain antitoxin